MTRHGSSVVEVVLAAAIFTLVAIGIMRVAIQALEGNRLAGEQVVAEAFAQEGLEALRSMRNRDLAEVSNTAGSGLGRVAGVWDYAGVNNVFDKYTRVIGVEDARRDGAGNIVGSGGSVDTKTKKLTSTVTWQVNAGHNSQVSLTDYLTDWREPVFLGGMLAYGEGGTTSDAMRYRFLNGVTKMWGGILAFDVVPGSTNRAIRSLRLYANSVRNEKIMLTRHFNGSQQFIYASVWNGGGWSSTQLGSWSATTFLDARNFDGAFSLSGDFIAIYSDNTNIPKYRIWNGSSWSAQTNTQNIGGVPVYITVKSRPDTDEVMVAVFDNQSDVNTLYFDSGGITAATQHATAAPVNTKELVDFAWSKTDPTKGALIYANGATDRSVNIKIWIANGVGSGNWSSAAQTVNQGVLGAMSIAGRTGGSSEFLACDKDASNDIYCFESDTTPSWTIPLNNVLTTTTQTGIQRSFDVVFENLTGTEALAVYSDNTTVPKYRVYNASSNSFGTASAVSAAASGVINTVRIRELSDLDDAMVLFGDANRRLYSIAWNGTGNSMYSAPAGLTLTAHGTNGSAVTDYWYDFVWDKYIQ